MHGAEEEGRREVLLVALLLSSVLLLPAACSPAKFRLCGKNLADLLSLVCRGRGFYDPFAAKPSGPRGEVVHENRVGVSDECCRMGCTEATLESYCAPLSDDDYGGTEIHLFGDRRQGTAASRGTEEGRGADGSASAEVSTVSKTDADGTRRQVRRPSFQIGTIPPNFLGTPVILPRTKAARVS